MNCGLDLGDRLGIALRDEYAGGILRSASVNGFCLPDIRIAQAAYARDNLCGVDCGIIYCVCHDRILLIFNWVGEIVRRRSDVDFLTLVRLRNKHWFALGFYDEHADRFLEPLLPEQRRHCGNTEDFVFIWVESDPLDGLRNSCFVCVLAVTPALDHFPAVEPHAFEGFGKSNLAFLFTQEVLSFDTRVKTRYLEALSAMDDFVQRFLEVGTSTAKEVWLVKALLDLIDADQSIDNDQAFYIGEVGQKITKAALRDMSDFFFQPFLLGIWHFAVVIRKDNTEGKSTYDIWCPSQGGKERKYIGTMGVGITRSINVPLIEAASKKDPASTDEYSAPMENGDPVVDDFSEEPASTTTNQTINHPFVFHQYGNNSIQVGNIEMLVINNSGGEKREQ